MLPDAAWNNTVIFQLELGDLRSFQESPNSTNVTGTIFAVSSSLVFSDRNLADLSRSDKRVLYKYTMLLRLIVSARLYTCVRFRQLSEFELFPSFLGCHGASSIHFQGMKFVVGMLLMET